MPGARLIEARCVFVDALGFEPTQRLGQVSPVSLARPWRDSQDTMHVALRGMSHQQLNNGNPAAEKKNGATCVAPFLNSGAQERTRTSTELPAST